MKSNFTEMTDSQWQFVENIIDNKRVRRYSLRTIVNSIFWLVETGAQWRNMESKYPAWQTAYSATAVTIFGNLNCEGFGVNCLNLQQLG